MERDRIQEIIDMIMMLDGPDGHTDGCDVITDFIMSLLDGTSEEWIENYKAN